MIHHSKTLDIDSVIEEAKKHKNNPAFIHHCGHSKEWWSLCREAEYGDIIICDICNQCYVKSKNIVWFIKDRNDLLAHTNHLDNDVYYLIQPRIT